MPETRRSENPAPVAPISAAELLELGREVLRIEADAVLSLVDRLGPGFVQAVRLILDCRGRVVVSGIGKSGHVARKIAATMASTGTPAFFVHPAEASHGDLGMITPEDVVIALSNSGESAELVAIVPLLKRHGTTLIAITGVRTSTLATLADVHLDAAVEKEACPLGLAPTSSTTASLALGDALAVALLKARGFSAQDFARSHPGGKLGRRLLVRVSDVMHTGLNLPKVGIDSSLADALLEMSAKGLGMTAIIDHDHRILGIFTDGDLRRVLAGGADLRSARIADLMKHNPRTIDADRLAAEAVQQMENLRINGMLVADDDNRLVGVFNMHDLLRAGVL
ncbi:MAG: KpsF/GutQ family sugar-phosphate isomerase [Rhodoferax sp.]|uniref:KpsF/GutQ family sugar-phosphate isomerase n=1 Tax=Rhodoferax sp. TaxID=50421 RepID=UPI00271C24FF|nr:KpsF/GutQ family sugar-phosphate isomerase [Rhodoferax sp.]MDO8450891.1 KpsF/GutQ family sugar-phosphate isomerase [Rhodoferax sp.]